jgi:hypothetical protein
MGSGRRRTVPRWVFWTAVLACVGLLAGGLVYAWTGYQQTNGPAGAVTGYFAALQRGDAAAALGFGTVPDGDHSLLTAPVLAEQRRLAPIRDVTVLSTSRQGGTATVTVRYLLGFPAQARQVTDRIAVTRAGHGWRLDRVAALTHLDLTGARERASILGSEVSEGDVLLFPGAIPISFDTNYLQLPDASASVRLSQSEETLLSVDVSAAGRAAVTAALNAAIANCLSGSGTPDPRCPLPAGQVVPGSVRGTLAPGALRDVRMSVRADAAGVITISGSDVSVRARYTSLDFNNRPLTRSGPVQLAVAATTFAVRPLRIYWSQS